MLRRAHRIGLSLLALAAGLSWLGCNTFTADLDRAIKHYDANQYQAAIALLDVVERDFDSLSTPQQTQFAYFLGMSHFRMNHRADARHWLGFAAAAEKKNQGALSADEQKRVDETLDGLNKEVYGIADDGGTAKTKTCKADTDCDKEMRCIDSACLAPSEPKAPGTSTKPAEPGASAEPKAPGPSKGDTPPKSP